MSVAYEFDYPLPVSELPVSPSARRRRPRAGVVQLCPPRGSAPLRLTRRGVVVLWCAVATLAAGLTLLAAVNGPDTEARPAAPAGSAVTVGRYDSLWSVAERIAPTRDPRATILDLVRVNHLNDRSVQPGQVLLVP